MERLRPIKLLDQPAKLWVQSDMLVDGVFFSSGRDTAQDLKQDRAEGKNICPVVEQFWVPKLLLWRHICRGSCDLTGLSLEL